MSIKTNHFKAMVDRMIEVIEDGDLPGNSLIRLKEYKKSYESKKSKKEKSKITGVFIDEIESFWDKGL